VLLLKKLQSVKELEVQVLLEVEILTRIIITIQEVEILVVVGVVE